MKVSTVALVLSLQELQPKGRREGGGQKRQERPATSVGQIQTPEGEGSRPCGLAGRTVIDRITPLETVYIGCPEL